MSHGLKAAVSQKMITHFFYGNGNVNHHLRAGFVEHNTQEAFGVILF